MEQLFKQKLLRSRELKVQTFGQALYPDSFWTPSLKKTSVSLKTLLPEEFTERRQVLESFEQFAQEKAKESPAGLIPIDGGEIVLKPEPSWEGTVMVRDLHELRGHLSLPAEMLDLVFSRKAKGKIQVLFVTETFRPWEETKGELKEGFINELIVGFPLKTAELFERMITAMKLLPEEVFIYPVEWQGKDLAPEVVSIVSALEPELVVTLGAKATQKILKNNDRLSLIHGQFFKRTLSAETSFQVVPLFHPSIIETNQNMKKTAWSDMQKIMKHLKKLT